MTQPLALVVYEKLLPGTQLVNRLHDLGYRVHTLDNPALLSGAATELRPMIAIADLAFRNGGMCEAIQQLRQAPTTSHIPVVAFAHETDAELQAMARQAGARLVVNESALLVHLPQFLERALEIE